MLHTWDSGNYFFERPTDSSATDTAAPPRPPAGYTVKVRDEADSSALPDLSTDPGGHWSYSADKNAAKMGIQFSTDGGTTWSMTLWSQQSFTNAMDAGDNAAAALVQVGDLSDSVDALSSNVDSLRDQIHNSVAGVSEVNGKTGVVSLTAADVGARPAGTVPASDVTGLSTVATNGQYYSLSGIPAAAIPLTDKGAANGVPTLDASKKIQVDFLPSGFGTVGKVAGKSPDSEGNVDLLPSDIGAVATTDNIAASKITGLATVATSGSYNDLTDRPATLSDRVMINSDGTWPNRPSSSKPIQWDDTVYVAAGNPSTPPSIGGTGAVDNLDYYWTLEDA